MNISSSTSVHSLLANFKSLVELVIKFSGDSLTSQYGAVERIRSAILSILLHGFKETNEDIYDHFWRLILRLNSNSEKYIHLLREIYDQNDLRSTVEQWLDQSVITQCLLEQLSSIENDFGLLECYYHNDAFLRIPPFYHAFMICIRTIESGDPSLLASIDPKLLIAGFHHTIPSTNDVIGRSYSATTPPTFRQITNVSIDYDQRKLYPIDKPRVLHRRINSDPIHYFDNKPRNTSDVSSSYMQNDVQVNQEENQSNRSYSMEYESGDDSFLFTERSLQNKSNQSFASLPIKPIDQEEHQFNPPTIISDSTEDFVAVHLTYSSLFWPKKGQTLDNYIQEYDSQTRTQVEKDNVHFYFSEAIISASEYIKFNEAYQKYFDPIEDNALPLNDINRKFSTNDVSAEAIALTIIETWKNPKIPVVSELFWMIPHEGELSEEFTSIPDSRILERSDENTSIEGSERILRRGNSQWAPLREQLIFHIHQPDSRDIQLKKQNYLCPGCGRDVEKGYAHRFRYCEYTGKYFCRSCHSNKKFYLPSYIITKWDFSNRHIISNFAYDYLNRIFPEPIFNLNDLNPKLFERSSKLRTVNELRWALYSLRYYILACRFAEEKGCQQFLLALPAYVYEQPHVYSLEDLVKTKSNELHKIYEPIMINLRDHVLGCPLCCAKGFICEICNNEKNIIFPFNIQTTSVCSVCQSCFHIQCHKSQKYACPKCQRARHRNALTSSSFSSSTYRFYT